VVDEGARKTERYFDHVLLFVVVSQKERCCDKIYSYCNVDTRKRLYTECQKKLFSFPICCNPDLGMALNFIAIVILPKKLA
jgi:hypothetical protein